MIFYAPWELIANKHVCSLKAGAGKTVERAYQLARTFGRLQTERIEKRFMAISIASVAKQTIVKFSSYMQASTETFSTITSSL